MCKYCCVSEWCSENAGNACLNTVNQCLWSFAYTGGCRLAMLDKQSLFGRHSGLDDAVALLTLLVKRAGAVCLLKRAFVET